MTRSPIIVPPATIGILGGGQLGRYAVIAATVMGYRTVVLDPDPSAPAGRVADEHLVAGYDDPDALRRLGLECDAVTTEFENPPAVALEQLAGTVPVFPTPASVAIAQDRIAEKAFLVDNGFPVGPHVSLSGGESPGTMHSDEAIRTQRNGDPAMAGRVPGAIDRRLGDLVAEGAIVKTARLGYDGKGQRRVDSVAAVHAAVAEMGGVDCIVEALLPLDAELSVVVVRTADGSAETYEPAENHHVDGILDLSVVPARVAPALADRALGLALAVADALGYVGVLAVELFVVGDDLFVNEIAPRPHNSGHWTLDAARSSQFEQQIRALCGLAIGSTAMTAPAAAMVNLLGDLWSRGEPNWSAVLDDPEAKLHLYGKHQPRAGRKMGHLTVTAPDPNVAVARALNLRDLL